MTRRPLGRGLDALISGEVSTSLDGLPSEATMPDRSPPGIMMVEPERIVASRFQPRQVFEPGALEELASAIKAQGVIEPLIVRRLSDTSFELIAGERRLRASRIAELERVPVIVRELDDRAAVEVSLVENLLREDLNPIEEGNAFSRLNREFSLTHEEIANRIGKSRAYVSNIIRLTELPPPILEMLNGGVLTAGQVRPLLTLASSDEQVRQARLIADGKLSARDAEQLAAAKKRASNGKPTNRPELDPNLKSLCDSVQRALKRKVRITRRRGRHPGRVELEYYSDDDLTILARSLMQNTMQ